MGLKLKICLLSSAVCCMHYSIHCMCPMYRYCRCEFKIPVCVEMAKPKKKKKSQVEEEEIIITAYSKVRVTQKSGSHSCQGHPDVRVTQLSGSPRSQGHTAVRVTQKSGPHSSQGHTEVRVKQ